MLVQVSHHTASQFFDVVIFIDQNSDASSLCNLQMHNQDHSIVLGIILNNVSVIQAKVDNFFVHVRAATVLALAIVTIHLMMIVVAIALAIIKPVIIWSVLSSMVASIGVAMRVSTDMLRVLASSVMTIVICINEKGIVLIVLVMEVKVA